LFRRKYHSYPDNELDSYYVDKIKKTTKELWIIPPTAALIILLCLYIYEWTT